MVMHSFRMTADRWVDLLPRWEPPNRLDGRSRRSPLCPQRPSAGEEEEGVSAWGRPPGSTLPSCSLGDICRPTAASALHLLLIYVFH